MPRTRRNIWPTLLLCSSLIAVGGVVGFFIRPLVMPTVVATEEPASPGDDSGHGGSPMVELLEVTMNNMDLQSGKFEVRDYFQQIRIPAQVVEQVPLSRRYVSAPFSGRISKVLIARGQAVKPGQELFEIQIIDESLSQSQVGLLGVISEISVNQKTLERLTPLAESGVVKRSRIVDLELDRDSLIQRREALKQELLIRGMDEFKIKDLVENKKLMQTITVNAPDMIAESPIASESPDGRTIQTVSLERPTEPTHDADLAEEQYFTVESISALEGSNQQLGASLCELTYHSTMLIEGMAFESDIEKISIANEQGWRFTAQFGEKQNALIRKDLKLFQIENHVDNRSQTYPIFVQLDNEIVSKTTDEQGRTYVNWRFKPGQRAHLEFPIEVWKDQVVVPLAALAREGPENFVFQKISHTHESDAGTIHEFKKVPVKVLHTDKHHAVLKKDIHLDVYEEYALNQAFKLNLALKRAAGGGADPHAGHSH